MATEIFNYSSKTGEYLPSKTPIFARVDPLDRLNIPVPRNATLLKPPATYNNQVAIFTNGSWQIQPDFRGVRYIDLDGLDVTISEIGVEPPDTSAKVYLDADKNRAVVKKRLEINIVCMAAISNISVEFSGKFYLNTTGSFHSLFALVSPLDAKADLPTYEGTANAGCLRATDGVYVKFTKETFLKLYAIYCKEVVKKKSRKDELLDILRQMENDPLKYADDVDAIAV